MLQLQRASAGSGKTYMLAKKFIEYFISTKENGVQRLRTKRELRDSLSHILAITFTNKATNEMKLRIVEKLDALGNWNPSIPVKKVDYLDEFSQLFGSTYQEISDICRAALRILLNDYGDFKVSTIDSFFQTVLRTFTFEADLDDSYQIELDSDFVSQAGLDSTLDEIEASEDSAKGLEWILKMIDDSSDKGKGWNIFQKNSRNPFSIYSQVLKASRQIDKEDFKEVRESLDRFFAENEDFYGLYLKLSAHYETPVKEAHKAMRSAAKLLRKGFREHGIDIKSQGGTYLDGRSKKMAEDWNWDHSKEDDIKFAIPEFTRKGATKRVLHPGKENPFLGTPVEDELEGIAVEMFEAFDNWRTQVRSSAFRKWKVYKETLPYLGLLQSVRANIRTFLNDSNTVQLNETNSILRRIIGEDDAPFIYERIGSRLEHFLIDEFQDTSRLQWKNLHPLLSESEGKGNDNLIIGDPKQSIYRFRNADPALITTTVPEQFSHTVRECGDTPQENTNWRSARRIVEFNNLFFRYLTNEVSSYMRDLYTNTVQPPHHTEDEGYVRVEFTPNTPSGEIPEHFRKIPELITELMERGYRQSEIAILTDTTKDGRAIISCLIDHNRTCPEHQKIEFISAESLAIGDSTAVQTIVSVLEAIEKGTKAELNPPEERKKKGIGDWSKLKANFNFYAMSHRDQSLSEQMAKFLDGEYDPEAIPGMLSEMQSTALPALIENIIEKFLPEDIRKGDAPFLAAFQDLAGSFCETNTTDIASFLQWWNLKGKNKSLASPEGTEAVEIMTIHKSKGLEFRCVIVANATQTTEPYTSLHKEWLWVTPDFSDAPGVTPIPWLPVVTSAELESTPHAEQYREYLQKFMMDKVNMAYVAFTRAVDELYIFTPMRTKLKKEVQIYHYLKKLADEAHQITESLCSEFPGIKPYIPDPNLFMIEETLETEEEGEEKNAVWELGEKADRAAIERKRKDKGDGDSVSPIPDYKSNSDLPQLRYVEGDELEKDAEEGDDGKETAETSTSPEETDEQRQRGQLLHAVFENIRVPSDLHNALLRLKTRGHLDFRTMSELEKELSAAIAEVGKYGWFDEGLTLLNERGIMSNGFLNRPDRVILHPGGKAVIVDYKFGEHRNDKGYSRQLARYSRLLKEAGVAKETEAYIWYVSLGEVVKIP